MIKWVDTIKHPNKHERKIITLLQNTTFYFNEGHVKLTRGFVQNTFLNETNAVVHYYSPN